MLPQFFHIWGDPNVLTLWATHSFVRSEPQDMDFQAFESPRHGLKPRVTKVWLSSHVLVVFTWNIWLGSWWLQFKPLLNLLSTSCTINVRKAQFGCLRFIKSFKWTRLIWNGSLSQKMKAYQELKHGYTESIFLQEIIIPSAWECEAPLTRLCILLCIWTSSEDLTLA